MLLQIFGVSIFLLPVHLGLLGWKWVRNTPVHAPWARIFGSLALWFCLATACGLAPRHWLIGGAIRPSGIVGMVIADYLRARCELAGAAIITAAAGVVALYFATTFEVAVLTRLFGGTITKVRARLAAWRAARAEQRARSVEKSEGEGSGTGGALPSTDLLNEAPSGNGYDSFELKEVAGKIKSKLEEFNVRGSVVQINPGPVVTTFEYKPEAGVKYSRITTLMEDLCLGLQAESVLIERLPGKSDRRH
jgi:hypothetical protein